MKRCGAIRADGRQCSLAAETGDYCEIHGVEEASASESLTSIHSEEDEGEELSDSLEDQSYSEGSDLESVYSKFRDDQEVLSPLYEPDIDYVSRPACLKRGAPFVKMEDLEKECLDLKITDLFRIARSIVKQRAHEVTRHGLNWQQAIALCLYTMESKRGKFNMYTAVNQALRDYRPQHKDIPHVRCLLTLIQSAVFKLSRSTNNKPIYRMMAVQLDKDMYQKVVKGESFRFWFPNFSSCSLKRFMSQTFVKEDHYNVRFQILSWKGAYLKWISSNPQEEEVLLPAYTLFRVVGHRIRDGYLEVDLHSVYL
jgi:hypothetical protein